MKLKQSLIFFKSAALAGILVITVGCVLIYEQMAKNATMTRKMDMLQNSINQLVDQEAAFITDRTLHGGVAEIKPLVGAYSLQQQSLLSEIESIPYLFERLQALDKSVHEFAMVYEQMVSLQALVGFDQQSGRYGRFRDAAHALQRESENSNDLRLTTLILELRRREKDFLLRFDSVYLQMHEKLIEETSTYVSKLGQSKETLQPLLVTYKQNFDTYVEILQKQGLTPNQGLRGESKLAQQAMRLQLSALSEVLIQHSQLETERLIWWVLLLMVVITTANYALLNYLNGRISNDILAINKTLFKVTKNEDFSLRIDSKGNDEIAQISHQLDELLEFIETLLSRLSAAQQRLIEEAKMAGLGNMVSGFAHELNTPLGIAITSHSHLKSKMETLREDFDSGKLKKHTLSELISEAEAAMTLLENNLMKTANLIDDFKEVAVHQRQDCKSEFSLKSLIKGVLDCYESELVEPEYVVTLEIPDNLYLFSYPSAFNQIFRYTINNCIKHAKIEGKPLAITLSAKVVNDYIHLYCKDDGHGISKDLLPLVFEPFVTSKRNQGGTGLGLSVTYNLVTQKLEGEIKMQSLPQGGVCIHIILPNTTFNLKD
ncbi:sensor histidine kinase [Pseudoalteromonas xiamenensis]